MKILNLKSEKIVHLVNMKNRQSKYFLSYILTNSVRCRLFIKKDNYFKILWIKKLYRLR